MLIADDILHFAYQCCDALQYLQMGERCAETGVCYDALRPMGAVYWYALPFRLHIAPQWLVAFHGVLLLVASALGAAALRSCAVGAASSRWCRAWSPWLILSAAIHLVWCYPFILVALSDLPASLLALSGCWLLLLSGNGRRPLLVALAGLSLGLACWLRTFFLYPLYALLLVWALLHLRRPSRSAAMLFTALLPILCQYAVTWRDSGQWGYLHPDWSRGWTAVHLQDPASGYDTVTLQQYRWHKAPCDTAPPLQAWQQGDWLALTCTALGRWYFYLGSYSDKAFHDDPQRNLLQAEGTFDRASALYPWQLHGIRHTDDVWRDVFDNDRLNEAARVAQIDCQQRDSELCRTLSASTTTDRGLEMLVMYPTGEHSESYLEQPLWLSPAVYSASVQLWAAVPTRVDLVLLDSSGQPVALRSGTAVPEALTSLTLNFPVLSAGHYRWRLTRHDVPDTAPLLIAMVPWLNAGPVAVPPASPYPPVPGSIRSWSPVLLLVNSLAGMLALVFLCRGIRRQDVGVTAVAGFLLASVAVALGIVPEQRFFIAPLAMIWLCAVMAVVALLGSRPTAREVGP